jgi:hypothetical protein
VDQCKAAPAGTVVEVEVEVEGKAAPVDTVVEVEVEVEAAPAPHTVYCKSGDMFRPVSSFQQ